MARHIGAQQAQREGNLEIAAALRANASLLTAIYRIAQDVGYEWGGARISTWFPLPAEVAPLIRFGRGGFTP